MITIAKDHERGLFTCQKFFDDDFFSRFTKGFLHQDSVTNGHGSIDVRANDNALASGEAIRFDHIWRFLLCEIFFGRCRIREGSKRCRRNIVLMQNRFRKGFAAFQSSGRLVRSKDSQATRFKEVAYTQGKRQFRSDDCKIDFFFSSEISEFLDLLRPAGDALSQFSDGRAAWSAEEFGYFRTLADFPYQRVLAAAAADDQNFHDLPRRNRTGDREW